MSTTVKRNRRVVTSDPAGARCIHRPLSGCLPPSARIPIGLFCHSTSVYVVGRGSYRGRMRAVGIKTLNNRLSKYVRLAASGETILVTDRDRVVAELGPLRESRSPILADALSCRGSAVRRARAAGACGLGTAAQARPGRHAG